MYDRDGQEIFCPTCLCPDMLEQTGTHSFRCTLCDTAFSWTPEGIFVPPVTEGEKEEE